MGVDVVACREMRALEANAEYFGISPLQLMENAGSRVASEVLARFDPKETRVAIFCGLGGNGGDGFVIARQLLSLGYRVEVIVAGSGTAIRHGAALENWLALQPLRNQLKILEVNDSSEAPDVKADLVVDALLGVGLKGIPRQPVLGLIKTINETDAFCLSVDAPTGLDSDSGQVLGEAVKADLTVTFHKAKPGLLKAEGFVGELLVKSIGLPDAIESFAGPGDVNLVVKARPHAAHKGDFGKLLVVGGSEIYHGAPALVALAALRTGADLVYVAAPEKTARAISSIAPELVTIKLEGNHLSRESVHEIRPYLDRATAAVIGPGLGLHKETREAVEELLARAEEAEKPMLLDADGLKAFSEFRRPLQVPSVLTPHSEEYTELTGKRLPLKPEERAESVKKAAARLDAVVLLKGSTDIVSDGRRTKLNFSGNPGMTVGGTGDVLSGIVGAFLAQQAGPFEAAVAGAFINGAAGDFVESQKGYHMFPTDLLDWIPKIIDDPMSHSRLREIARQR